MFRYRIDIKSELPANVKNRAQCYYGIFLFIMIYFNKYFLIKGINCRTMKHNKSHAEKLDHVCE